VRTLRARMAVNDMRNELFPYLTDVEGSSSVPRLYQNVSQLSWLSG